MWPLSRNQSTLLTFTGGPLDGYAEDNDTPLRDLPEVLGVLVSPNVVETLTTHETVIDAPPTSLAFYQRGGIKKRHYSFVGSTAPEMAELNDMSARKGN